MLTKLQLKPGVNRENTSYQQETGWYECDKIRFRAGTPETIGGWQQISNDTYLGVCRSMWNWVTLGGANIISVGTNLKYYLQNGGAYYDITPIRSTTTGTATFAATNGSSILTVTDVANGVLIGDFVTFSDAVSLGGNITALVLNQEYQVIGSATLDAYTIDVGVVADASDTGDGGAAVVAEYQVNVGPAVQIPLVGWGAGTWGTGAWGVGTSSPNSLRIWTQNNFGEDLIFGPRGGGMYYWTASSGITARGVPLQSLAGASDVPTKQNIILVSDVSRFAVAFGANEIGSATQDPMLIRWSDQEDASNWTPSALNQAGGLRLSHGSEIITAIQTRQEILVFTDMSVYSMQYLGPPAVWGATLLADGISIIGPNSVAVAAGVTYWMGVDKFYKYDGNVTTVVCDLRQHVFGNINLAQGYQAFGGINEAFNEVWWFYCSANSTVVDKYVIYNYVENIWYYGTMQRSAWIGADVSDFPVAATYSNNLVNHEVGVDNNETSTSLPLNAYIETAEWDVGDGDSFTFIRRVLPDVTFRSSTGDLAPQLTMTIKPMKNSGSGYNNPLSNGGNPSAGVIRIAQAPIEEFTGQVFIRVRGRQFVLRYESDQLGTAWQTGATRIDFQKDGRRG
tara:strand:+ start:431 stop:2299 length:1869 start_codon:yes stop_codon:yes gene_type:complete